MLKADQFEAEKKAIQFQEMYYPNTCLLRQKEQGEAIRFAFAQGFKRAENVTEDKMNDIEKWADGLTDDECKKALVDCVEWMIEGVDLRVRNNGDGPYWEATGEMLVETEEGEEAE